MKKQNTLKHPPSPWKTQKDNLHPKFCSYCGGTKIRMVCRGINSHAEWDQVCHDCKAINSFELLPGFLHRPHSRLSVSFSV